MVVKVRGRALDLGMTVERTPIAPAQTQRPFPTTTTIPEHCGTIVMLECSPWLPPPIRQPGTVQESAASLEGQGLCPQPGWLCVSRGKGRSKLLQVLPTCSQAAF